MNKKDLVNKITEVLCDNNIRKPVSAQKSVLHISDDDGNQSDFVIKKPSTNLLFTNKDTSAFVDAALLVIEEALKNGEDITIHGFGSLGLKLRAARRTKHPETGEDVEIDARYVPKFSFGQNLRTAAKLYELSLNENKRGD